MSLFKTKILKQNAFMSVDVCRCIKWIKSGTEWGNLKEGNTHLVKQWDEWISKHFCWIVSFMMNDKDNTWIFTKHWLVGDILLWISGMNRLTLFEQNFKNE